MLEIRKNSFSQNYENSFFRTFSKNLYEKFEQKNLEGVLIGSPFCSIDERLQIDALLITSNSICLIDFKNYGGKIKLPNQQNFDTDSGFWINEEGVNVKGGSYNNPFIQLKKQKQRFIKIFIDYIQENLEYDDKCNPYHCIRVVCFQKEVELLGEVPGNHEKNFKILHRGNYLSGLIDILEINTSEIKLGTNSFNQFKRLFQAEKYNFDEDIAKDVFQEISEQEYNLDFSILYEDQQEALNKISDFIKNPQKQVFILQGTSNSGKSFLIPYIEKIAEQLGIEEVLLFAQSKRVARNLMANYSAKNINSIYSYIYGGNSIKAIDDDPDENEENDKTEEVDIIDIVPLKKCENSDNSIFIVDESHLISDSYYESFDLRFGSGHILRDYLEFTNFKNSPRKIIFIGDPFQLGIGNAQESPLNSQYLQEDYNLIVDFAQLLDKPNYSLINNEALKCVSAIRNNIFNDLQIEQASDNVIHLQKEQIATYLSQLNKADIHILCYSNEKANEINLWIKRKLLNSGETLAVGDIVLFHNNITVADNNDPFAPTKSIYNGNFGEITLIFESNTEEIRTKNTSVTLNFRVVDVQLGENKKICRVLLLENYLVNPKGELNKEEKIALKRILNKYLKEEISGHPFESSNECHSVINSEEYRILETEILQLKIRLNNGEKVKTKLAESEKKLTRLLNKAKQQYKNKIKLRLQNDPSSQYFKFKNIAFIKYGYAMTVHKAISYKWPQVIFNVDQGENGRTNSSYFKWLYTGISRAISQIILYGCEPINPLSHPDLKIQNSTNKNISKDWVESYFTSKQSSDIDQLFTALNENLKQDFTVSAQ